MQVPLGREHSSVDDLFFQCSAPHMELGLHRSQSLSREDATEKCRAVGELQTNIGQGTLCSPCRSIDFITAFRTESRSTGYYGLPVSEHRTITSLTCRLCSFILSFDPPELQKATDGDIVQDGYHLRAFDSLKMQKLLRNEREQLHPSIVLAVVPGPPMTNSTDISKLNSAISKGVIVPASPAQIMPGLEEGPYGYHGRKIHHSRVDFSLLRSWLVECSRSHSTCAGTPGARDLRTKVIDCHSREIVAWESAFVYFALSYVWGTPEGSPKSSTKSGVSSVPLPAHRSIEDAIKVVRELGYRYLWVDTYCIQEGPEKDYQIRNMHLVYEGALATIVALTANNSDSPIPGVSIARRSQPYVNTDMGLLVSTMPHLSQHATRSKWYTRAWTYQETFLSRRCFFFTRDQVFFACKDSVRTECVCQASIDVSDPGRERLTTALFDLHAQLYYRGRLTERPTFGNHVSGYSSRFLTHKSDGLNAFRGMLARQQYYTYWGVPLIRMSTDIDTSDELRLSFLKGLCWDSIRGHHGNTTRRPNFPSWSWVSIVGEVASAHEYWTSNGGVFERVSICVEHLDGTIEEVVEFFHRTKPNPEVSRLIQELSPYLHITGFVAKFRVKCLSVNQYQAYPVEVLFNNEEEEKRKFLAAVSIDLVTKEITMEKVLSTAWDAIALTGTRYWLLFTDTADTSIRFGRIFHNQRLPTGEIQGKVRTIRFG